MDSSARQPWRRLLAIGAIVGLGAVLIFSFAEYGLTLAGASAAATFLGLAAIFQLIAGLKRWGWPSQEEVQETPHSARASGATADATEAMVTDLAEDPAAVGAAAAALRSAARLLTGPRALLSSTLLATVAIIVVVTSATTTPRQNVTVSCHGSRPVPDVLHLSQDAATAKLLQNCFVPEPGYMGTTSGYVSFQNPKPGTRQPARAAVYLVLVPKTSLPSR